MKHSSHLALLALSLFLSACGTVPGILTSDRKSPPEIPPAERAGQLEFSLASGTYRCEDGTRLMVERETRDRVNHRVKIGWNGNSYRLDRDPSYSGIPRFEDSKSGLVWIDLPWKGLLLDGRSNKPIANECRSI